MNIGIASECLSLIASCLASGIAIEPLPPKPGCVSRLRDFEDKRLSDFVLCSHMATYTLTNAIRDGLEGKPRVGTRIRELVEACLKLVGRNVCLGTSILLTPLATAAGIAISRGLVPTSELLAKLAREVIELATVEDSIELYKAIRAVAPSYVKPNDDVRAPNVWSPSFEKELVEGQWTLLKVLIEASSRDLVAREVVEGYPRVLKCVKVIEGARDLEEGCVRAFLELLASEVDTVVARKGGLALALRTLRLAREVLRGSKPIDYLDETLSEARVSPGSVADIVATALSLVVLKRVVEAYHDRIKLCVAAFTTR